MIEELLPFYVVGILIWCLIWGFVCNRVVASKGYDDEDNKGFWWGFFLGLIGLIVCAVKPVVERPRYNYNENITRNDRQYSKPVEQHEWLCSCGSKNPSYATSCYNCGKRINEATAAKQAVGGWRCSNCGTRNEKSVNICSSCGKEKFSNKPQPIQVKETYVTKESSISDQIKEINKLKEEGFITEEEYEAKKKQILGI